GGPTKMMSWSEICCQESRLLRVSSISGLRDARSLASKTAALASPAPVKEYDGLISEPPNRRRRSAIRSDLPASSQSLALGSRKNPYSGMRRKNGAPMQSSKERLLSSPGPQRVSSSGVHSARLDVPRRDATNRMLATPAHSNRRASS